MGAHPIPSATQSTKPIVSNSIVITSPLTIELKSEPKPITAAWVLSGTPVSRTESLGRSHDFTSDNIIWECSAGRFDWHYGQDEALVVIAGEAFITSGNGVERRLGPCDFAFFPAGCTATWRVPEFVRKVAVVQETLWRPLGFALKASKKLLRMAGLSGAAPL
jgi:hypothetical protein